MAAQGNKVQSKRAACAPRIIDARRLSLTEGSNASNRNKAQPPCVWERAILFFRLITSRKFYCRFGESRDLTASPQRRHAHALTRPRVAAACADRLRARAGALRSSKCNRG